jgi:hypothetical protein
MQRNLTFYFTMVAGLERKISPQLEALAYFLRLSLNRTVASKNKNNRQ